jgi:hypothetical protein
LPDTIHDLHSTAPQMAFFLLPDSDPGPGPITR